MFTVFLRTPTCGETHANLTQLSDELEKSITQLKYISYQIVGPSLIIAGILGNILNLIVLSRPFINECTRIYLRVLAAADLVLLLLEISSFVRLNDLQNDSPLTAIYYAHIELVCTTSLIAFNVYTVLCLTIDRYISVCLPTLFDLVHTPKRAKVLLVISSIFAILISLPLSALKTTCRMSHKWSFQDNIVVTDTLYWKIYIGVSETLIRIAPAIILAVLNILIIRKFRSIQKTRSRLSTRQTRSSRKRYKEEKRLIRLLQAVVLSFFFTMIPSSCLSFVYSECREHDLKFETFRAMANLLEVANSSLNFCAYFMCSKEFRKSILDAFRLSSDVTVHKAVSSLTNNDFNQNTVVAESNNTIVTITNLHNKINR